MVELKRPNLKLVDSYFDFIEEMRIHGEKIWEGVLPRAGESSSLFVDRLLRAETSPEVPLVPETIYWAVDGNQVVGRIALRHLLNENLREFGGHVGYEVRPSCRRRGVGKEMLRLLLESQKAIEIGRLLLTCAPNNVPSNKTILANGGVLTKTAFVESRQRDTNYYWIYLDCPSPSLHEGK